MRRHSSFIFLFCGIFLPRILGFPQANTSIDCDSLLPNYEAVPQTSAPPYIIAVSFDNFEPENEVQVTLEALQDVGFKGFNLQAREIDGDVPVGTFKITDPNTKGMECHNVTNSAVSHANSDVKQKVTTTWIAPHGVKDLQFIATVVQDLEKFWVGIQSKTLTPTHSESVNGTGKSKRKVMIALECKKLGGTYTTQGGCVMVGPSSSSQSSYSGSSNAAVYTISKNGCGPGGAADAYSQQACRDNAPSSSGISYGLSVPSSSSESSKKVVVVANSNPFPPVRHTYPQSLGSSAARVVIQSAPRPQSSSTYVLTPQSSQYSGQVSRPQSVSYTLTPQSSQYSGQGSRPQSVSYTLTPQSSQYSGQGSRPQSVSYNLGGSGYAGGSNGCGQGVSYDSNPCHQGGSYSLQTYDGSQGGSPSSQSYGGNQGGSYSQGYSGGQGGSDTYYDNQDSQGYSDDNACDDSDTTYSANVQSSGCAKKKVLVARDTSHVLSKRAYDAQNESSTSNSSHSNPQGGSFIATHGSSQGGCVCPDGSSGSRQDGQGSSYGSYSGNQGGSSYSPGGSYGQDGQDSSYGSYSGNQGGSSYSPGGSYGQGGPSAYDSSSESYGQGGSSTYSGAGSYGQDSPSIGGSDSDNGSSSLSGSQQNERDFYSPGGSQSGGHGSSSQGGGYSSGQDSSSSGSSQYGGQGSSGGSQYGGQGGCDCSGTSSGSSSSGGSQYSGQDSYSSGPSQYGGQGASSYGGSQYGGQGSPYSGGSQYGRQGSSYSGGSSQYGGQGPSSYGGSQYGGQGQGSSGGSQYGGQGGCVCPGGSTGSSSSGSSQYGGQGSSGSSRYGGQGSPSSGSSHQGKPGSSTSGSTYSGKPNSPSLGGSQVSSAGKHSTPGFLLLFSVLSAFALSAATSKWSI